jgi:hypothetical protein
LGLTIDAVWIHAKLVPFLSIAVGVREQLEIGAISAKVVRPAVNLFIDRCAFGITKAKMLRPVQPPVESPIACEDHVVILQDTSAIGKKDQAFVAVPAKTKRGPDADEPLRDLSPVSPGGGPLRRTIGIKVEGQTQAAVTYDPLILIGFLKQDFLPLNMMCERAEMFEDRILSRSKQVFEYFGLPFEA